MKTTIASKQHILVVFQNVEEYDRGSLDIRAPTEHEIAMVGWSVGWLAHTNPNPHDLIVNCL